MSDENGELPDGWHHGSIGSMARICTGRLDANAAVDDGEFPFFTCADEVSSIDTVAFDCEAVLLAGNGGFNVKWYKGKFNAYQRTYVIEPDGICGRFLYHLIKNAIPKITDKNRGSTIKYLRLGDISDCEVKLPPNAEQRRIVGKIEALQERSRRAREALAEVGPLLEQLRQSLLAAAFRGDLTADWRAQNPDVEPASELLARIRTGRRQKWEQTELNKYQAKNKMPPKNWKDKYKEPEPVDESNLPELPNGWCWSSFDEISLIDGGLTRHQAKRSKSTKTAPLISVAAVQHGYIDSSQVSEIGLLNTDGNKATLEIGDLLIVEGNGSLDHIGRAAIWDGSIPNVRHQNHLIRVRSPISDTRYLLHWLASPRGRTCLVSEATSAAGLYNLSLSKVGRIPIPIAPLKEQNMIVEMVSSARDSLRVSQTQVGEIEATLSQLDQSILAKAFRGELVPQDPSDEPASVLLDRIRREREAAAPKKRSRKKK